MRLVSAPFLLVAILAGCLLAGTASADNEATAGAATGAATTVGVKIVSVSASGERQSGAKPTIDPKLELVRERLLKLPLNYASYTHEATDERSVGFADGMTITSAAGVKLHLVPSPSKSREKVTLVVDETAKGASAPCITTTIETGPGAPAAIFCDKVPGPGTLIFFVFGQAP